MRSLSIERKLIPYKLFTFLQIIKYYEALNYNEPHET